MRFRHLTRLCTAVRLRRLGSWRCRECARRRLVAAGRCNSVTLQMSCATELPGSICRGMVRPNDRTWATTWTARSPETGFREQATLSRQPAEGRPTLKTIAFMTGLGVTTVSRALEGCAGDRRGDAASRAACRPAGRLPAEPRRRAPAHRQDQRHQPDPRHRGAGDGLRLRHDLRHIGASRPDAVPSDRHALFAQQRSAGAGPLCRRDRLGRRHHHLAHRSPTTRGSATCSIAAFPSPPTAAPTWRSITRSTISTITPSR